MRQKTVKRLRKEAINYIKEQNAHKKFMEASYTKSPASNPYKNFIRQFRRDI